MKSSITGPHSRLSREDWLNRALDIFAKEGEAQLRIDRLVRHLGVTKGSFYWHFRDRSDFISSLANHWARVITTRVRDEIDNMKTGPSEKLRRLMEIVIGKKYGRYEVAMRAWAAHEPIVAPVVRKVDKVRLSFVRTLFAGLGFRGQELQTRTRIFVTYLSLESILLEPEPKKKKFEALENRLEFFTRP
jgi:AcrR family transcriptional regulator